MSCGQTYIPIGMSASGKSWSARSCEKAFKGRVCNYGGCLCGALFGLHCMRQGYLGTYDTADTVYNVIFDFGSSILFWLTLIAIVVSSPLRIFYPLLAYAHSYCGELSCPARLHLTHGVSMALSLQSPSPSEHFFQSGKYQFPPSYAAAALATSCPTLCYELFRGHVLRNSVM